MIENQLLHQLAISVPGFLVAIVFHEWAHAAMAYKFGDTTAKDHGRLTLNPQAHYDLVGTIIWPLICIFVFRGVVFGYAKPVPINPTRFKKVNLGIFWVSFAGPLMNIFLGVLFALLSIVFYIYIPNASQWKDIAIKVCDNAMIINFIIAFFNLIPFPPLDGSRMLSSMMSYENQRKYEQLQNYAIFFLLILWVTNIAHYLVFSPAIYAAQFFKGTFAYFLLPAFGQI